MKNIYLMVITALLLTSCQKDEIVPALEETATTSKNIQKINFTDLPEGILANFDNKKFVYYKGTKSKNMFGPARTDVPAVKNINKKGRVSYTILLRKVNESKGADSLYFDNLYIQETEEGEQRMCVIRYKPEETWYYSKDRSLKNFIGRIELFDLQGKSLGISTVFAENSTKTKTTVTECIYELTSTWCFGSFDTCTFTYSLKSCSTTSYGGTGGTSYNDYMDSSTYQGSSWDIKYDEYGNVVNGYSGDGDDDDIETNPVLPLAPDGDENTVKIRNLIDNPCASIIFNQMHLSAINQSITSSIVTPDGYILNLSDRVLNLFNNLKNLNYTIKDDNLNNSNATTTGLTTTVSETYLSSATELSIARTMIHEMIHAYLNYQYSPTESNDLSFRHLMDWYAIQTGLSVNTNKYHHEFMGGFINGMAYSLWQWDSNHGTGGNLGWNYYREMAAGGFTWKDANGNWQSYNSFDQLFPTASEKASARQTIENEATSTNSKGSKCD